MAISSRTLDIDYRCHHVVNRPEDVEPDRENIQTRTGT